MYHFYGIIDWSGHQHEADHSNSVDTIRKKFPSRSTYFKLVKQDALWLVGAEFKSARIGNTQLFLTGEIYNTAEALKTEGDWANIETSLLKKILREGETAMAGINGSFIIILVDYAAKTCKVINDHMSSLQVFYHTARDFVLFASELKYLFCHRACPRRIDWMSSLKRHIPFLVINAESHPEAWFEDIYLLEEASILEINSPGKLTRRLYWNPWHEVDNSKSNGAGNAGLADKYSAAYLDLLDDSVRLRCTMPGSAYSMFSGGLDSTIVTALARKYVDVETFSFATQATFRDGATEMCSRLAEDLDVRNTQIAIPFEELSMDGALWMKLIWSMESPIAHKDAFGKTALHAAISTIQPDALHIMSGTGSDQLNGGLVRWFANHDDDESSVQKWHHVMKEIRDEMLKPVIGHQYDTFWGSRHFLVNDFLSGMRPDYEMQYPWAPFVRGCLHHNQFILVWDELRAGNWHNRGVQFPFMDYRFLPFILSVPRHLHHELFFDKQILRTAANHVLPDYLTNKPKAPVQKPGEDHRMKAYAAIMLGNQEQVLQQLLTSIRQYNMPIDALLFESRVRHLGVEPDKAEWAYVMHLAGLIMLQQLPDQDEASSDMSADIMKHAAIISSAAPSALEEIRQQLSILPEADVLDLPLRFAPECSLVSDVFTGTYYLTRNGEMCFELDDDNPAWRTFLSSVNDVHSANMICQLNGLDMENFIEYLRMSLQEGILFTAETHE